MSTRDHQGSLARLLGNQQTEVVAPKRTDDLSGLYAMQADEGHRPKPWPDRPVRAHVPATGPS